MTKEETKLVERLHKITDRNRRAEEARLSKKPKLSGKAAKMTEFLSTDPFGCNNEQATTFASIMLGTEISVAKKEEISRVYEVGMVVVFKSGNDAVLISSINREGKIYGITKEGRVDPGSYRKDIDRSRHATKAEIRALVELMLSREELDPFLEFVLKG